MKKWLFKNREKSLLGKILNVVVAFIFIFLWSKISYELILFFISPNTTTPYVDGFHKYYTNPYFKFTDKYVLFFSCIFTAIWEEAAFRYAPIEIAKSINKKAIIPTVILSSIIFGYNHNYPMFGLLNQGFMGVIISGLYIKNNYSYLSCVAVHFMWNAFLYFLYQ